MLQEVRSRNEVAVSPIARILVGFDGSHHAHRACELAIEIAARFGSGLTLLNVRGPVDPEVDARLQELVPSAASGKTLTAALEELKERALAAGAARFETVNLVGDPLEELLAWLRQHPQDLVVVGSRGLSRGQRLLLGSLSSGLVNSAPCPVLVVRGHHGGHARVGAWDAPRSGPSSGAADPP